MRNSIRIILLLSLLSFEAPADEVFGPPPIVFSTQPQDVSVTLSETATFTISAIGALPISYQWRFNGSPIVGATNTQLVLTNVTDQNYGSYNVEATNPLGTAQSTSAFLIRPASLQVFPAVEVVMQLDPYRGYILESSSDLTAWTVLEFNLWTPEGKLSRLYQARDQKRYYRVRM
ncbi:MAG: immunoglobulin domain-containing protein, partial [Limisphaerales bacterium]